MWRRRKFITHMWESIVRGRDIWFSPEWTRADLSGPCGEKAREMETGKRGPSPATRRPKVQKGVGCQNVWTT